MQSGLPKDHPNTLLCMNTLGSLYANTGKLDLAEPLFRQVLDVRRRTLDPQDLRLAAALWQLGRNRLGQKMYADAEPLLRECLAIHEKSRPDAWETFSTKLSLGAALGGLAKHAEAEPLLVSGYEGLKERWATIPEPQRNKRLTEAIHRLVDLYTAWKKPDEAAGWQKVLDQQQANAGPSGGQTQKAAP
jgi:hypothetical protein